MDVLEPPKTPSDQLRLDCVKILPRLRLIIEFRPWLEHARVFPETPFTLVWNCFAFGASLCTLLDLLGSSLAGHSYIDVDKFDLQVGGAFVNRERAFSQFIQRVQLLEVQGRLRYGEVLRTDDLFGGTSAGFAKVVSSYFAGYLALTIPIDSADGRTSSYRSPRIIPWTVRAAERIADDEAAIHPRAVRQ